MSKISCKILLHLFVAIIEVTLRQRGRDLFSLSRNGILYDVTNSHFEGFCASNPKAKHGKNKQHRNDCRQIAGGIAFDEYGFPLAHETFEGNMSDTKPLPLILDSLTHHEDGLKPVAILDGGFSSRANLTLLKERGYSYIVNTTRGSRRLVRTRLPVSHAKLGLSTRSAVHSSRSFLYFQHHFHARVEIISDHSEM
jgi:transposase